MLRARSIDADELGLFAGLTPDAAEVSAQVHRFWQEGGGGRPEWTIVVEHDGRPVGRLALLAEPLGCGIEELEFRIAVPWLDFGHPDSTAAAAALFDAATNAARKHAPTIIEQRLNPEVHAQIPDWRATLAANGFELFQEKAGYTWTDAGHEQPPAERLTFSSMNDVGRDAYAHGMGYCIPGTLDRNDAYYLARCGPEAWGREMIGFLEEGDEPAWLLAHEPDGTLAGYVAVGGFEPEVGTIVHIGVAPERRGRGYVDELLRAANIAARQRGHRSMLSDADALNAPMRAALERNGHIPDVRPWHVWAYRRTVAPGVDSKRP